MKDWFFSTQGDTVEIFVNWYVFYGKQEAENMNEDRQVDTELS